MMARLMLTKDTKQDNLIKDVRDLKDVRKKGMICNLKCSMK